MRKRVEKIMMTLLRAGLWDTEPTNTELFPATPQEWNAVYIKAKIQTIHGVIFRGISKLREEHFPPHHLLITWLAETDKLERLNKYTEDVTAGIFACYQKWGISPILQKGSGIAALYLHPYDRMCGDIDIYFQKKKDFKKAMKHLTAEQVKIQRQSDGSFEYYNEGILVEHHKDLVDLLRPRARHYSKTMETNYGFEITKLENGTEVMTPTPELNLLQLNAHIMKHVFIVGSHLRQLCDIAMAYRAYHDQYNGKELQQIYQKAGLKKWTNLLHTVLVEEIGLPEEQLPYPLERTDTREMMDIVHKRGIYRRLHKGWYNTAEKKFSHKLHTLNTLVHKKEFIKKYAPKEGIFKFISLLMGQLNI